MQMALGCKKSGVDCLGKKAREWRCPSDAARGVICSVPQYMRLCDQVCNDPAISATRYASRMASGQPSWLIETTIMKRTMTWHDLQGRMIPRTGSLAIKGVLYRVEGSVQYEMDGLKVLTCNRQQSIAGRLSCRVTKSVAVTTVCIAAEAGCVSGAVDKRCQMIEDVERRKRGLIAEVLPRTCCSFKDATCVKHKFAKWAKQWKMPILAEPKSWTNLATAEALAV